MNEEEFLNEFVPSDCREDARIKFKEILRVKVSKTIDAFDSPVTGNTTPEEASKLLREAAKRR